MTKSSSVLGAYAPSGGFGHQQIIYFFEKLCFRCVRSLRFLSPANYILFFVNPVLGAHAPSGVFGHNK